MRTLAAGYETKDEYFKDVLAPQSSIFMTVRFSFDIVVSEILKADELDGVAAVAVTIFLERLQRVSENYDDPEQTHPWVLLPST